MMINEQFRLSLKNPVMKNHKVYGQELLPGLAFIDLLFQVFRKHQHDFAELELRNVSIYNPLTVSKTYDVLLSIRCTESQSGQWQIRVEGQERREDTLKPAKKCYITAEMHRTEPVRFKETLNLHQIKESVDQKIPFHEIYKQCRSQELIHTGFMKAEGTCFDVEGASIMNVSVGHEARASADNYLFHPILIDGSGVGATRLLNQLSDGDGRLFLPLHYESFRASELLQSECITRIQTESLERKNELISLDMEFFNATGEKVGELKKFVAKLVREAGLINPERGEKMAKPVVSARSEQQCESIENNGISVREAESFLRRLMADRLHIPEDQIESRVGYYELGLDSSGLLELVQAIEHKTGADLSPTLLFEYTTISELARYLTERYPLCFGQISNAGSAPNPSPAAVQETRVVSDASTLDIAIIGLAGRYPGAESMQTFWRNLKEGKDCVGEIPASRWDWRQFEDLQSASGKTMSKWGGFLDNPDYFDPRFFRIAPREAELMDPQERLFLQVCWEAIEDAGYTPGTLAPSRGPNQRRPVGVFVGVMHKDYGFIGAESVSQEQPFPLSINYAQIPNRVSYICDFHGPSMAVDTVCSSSLTAVHMALESLRHGESKVALAGGVNLSLHPHKYISYGMMGLHSSDGSCRTFGKGGDGYVSAEGIGAVLLKPLCQAVEDGDPVYAVIKSSAVNHGGRVSGMTVPSPIAQADMIIECLEKAGIDPRTITYVEAHGTGTSLGDPIEMEGLLNAYRRYTGALQFCSIGSVKSVLGHAESAAGISGLSKVALQLHHKTLTPSLHSEELNPYIDFEQSPFYVQQIQEPWKPAKIIEHGKEVVYPRRAGISSFGATGSNAHLILEEYVSSGRKQENRAARMPRVLVPLSAKNAERLDVYAQRLLQFLNEQNDVNLEDLAYTLQVGREAMEERLVFLISGLQELREKLEQFLQNKMTNGDGFRGEIKSNKERVDLLMQDHSKVDQWTVKKRIKKLAKWWVRGVAVKWELLYEKNRPGRINLPTYPFAEERYWLPAADIKLREKPGATIREEPDATKKPSDGDPLIGTRMLLPVWEPTPIEKEETFPMTSERVLIVGEGSNRLKERYPNAHDLTLQPHDGVDDLVKKLNAHDPVDHIFWLMPERELESPESEVYIKREQEGVCLCFRMLKALLQLGYGKKELGWTLITVLGQPVHSTDSVDPNQASFHGFFGSMAKEYPNWKIRVVDVGGYEDFPSTQILALPADDRGAAWGYRSGQWHRRQLLPFQLPLRGKSCCKIGGVYVVIGGAGGIGEVWSEYMIRTYQTRIIWIGRRAKDARIQAQLDALSAYGPAPTYLQADATDLNALRKAYREIKQRHEKINGVIHSALVVLSQNLQKMEEDAFQAVLSAKVEVSVRMAQVFFREPLDFVLFFSSVNAFINGAKHSNYVAGCNFKDAFARQLAQSWPCAVKVMNWGYWGGIGLLAESEGYQLWMKEKGIGSIEPPEGMEALEDLLAGSVDQVALMKTTKPSGMEGLPVNAQEWMVTYPEAVPSSMQSIKNRCPDRSRALRQARADGQIHIPELEELLCKLLWGQLQAMGMFNTRQCRVAELKENTGIRQFYGRWLEASIRVLEKAGYLRYDGATCRVADADVVDVDALWEDWDRQKGLWLDNPNLKAQIIILEKTIRALPRVLTGKRPATEVIFPNSSMELVEDLYKNNPVADYFNQAVADIVVGYLQEQLRRDQSFRIRILEIGAGTAGTSAIVFQKLQPYREVVQEYCFTDLSKAFLFHAENEYGPQNPYLTYTIFNIDVPLADQGIQAGEYDIVIAANVIHATKDIRRALRNAKAILRKNGLLLLSEMSENSVINHLAFSLLEGWWLYEDPLLRIPGCPGLYAETWQAVLEEEGFPSVYFPARNAHDMGLQIIAAESDGVVRQIRHASLSKKSAAVKTGRREIKPTFTGRGVTDEMIEAHIKESIIEQLSESLKITVDEISVEESFADYGLDSILGVQFIQAVNQTLNTELETTCLFDYTTVNQLTAYAMSQNGEKIAANLKGQIQKTEHLHNVVKPVETKRIHRQERHAGGKTGKGPIAVIGMSGRFAKSENVEVLWGHLARGTDLIEEASRWDLSNYTSNGSPDGKAFCKYGSFLEDIDRFDPLFFNITGLEATYMDPQQRIFLEESWKALEDAGYAGAEIEGQKCGVYVGCGGGDYQRLFEGAPPPQGFWGNLGSVIPARIAYYLNLQGPAIAIDTACSSSLVAIHLACQGLWGRETDLALGGGVCIQTTPEFYIAANRAGMLSAGGRCYTFDERADGFVLGEGVGVIVLKRLEEAMADRDHIYGVIRGSGINQDGATNGLTAPSANSQERLECDVYDSFGINPEHIQMVEAHGTGTKLGDPIECRALIQAFKRYTDHKAYCAIGSVKTNLGHTATAAGVAGVIKILLSIKHKQIPPSLHYRSGNSNIPFAGSPFYVNTRLSDWQIEGNAPRRAAISSFGASGTNAHMVIEETPSASMRSIEKPGYLMVLSANSADQLRRQVEQMVAYGEQNPQLDCGNMSFTLLMGRKHFRHRLACVVRHEQEWFQILQKWLVRGKAARLYVAELSGKDHREQPSLKQFGSESIEKCQAAKQPDEYLEHLAAVAELYIQGYRLAYQELFTGGDVGRISLPTYPLAGGRYWAADAGALAHPVVAPVPNRILMLKPEWITKAATSEYHSVKQMRRVVMLCKDWPFSKIKNLMNDAHCLLLCDAKAQEVQHRFQSAAIQAFKVIQEMIKSQPKETVLIQILAPFSHEFTGLLGLLKTAQLEYPKIIGQLIEVESEELPESLVGKLKENERCLEDTHIRYFKGQRQVNVLTRMGTALKPVEQPWREQGVYLITGGTGGVGLLFVEEIIRQVSEATLILVGRSALNEEKQAWLKNFRHWGGRIKYRQVDVSQREAVEGLIQTLQAEFGTLHGILHSAGIHRDNFILKKSPEEWHDVLGPKVSGVIHLDQATRDLALDFFVFFSSGAGVLGNPGQADYASANAFMDSFAAYRNRLVALEQRRGRTVSINWPLWKEGGMRIDEETEKAMRLEMGMTAMETASGIWAFYEALACGNDQVMVIEGNQSKMEEYFLQAAPSDHAAVSRTVSSSQNTERIQEKTIYQLNVLFSELIKVDIAKVDADEPLENYGLDSIMITVLNQRLAEIFKGLSKTLFFERQTLSELAEHLVSEHLQECMEWVGFVDQVEIDIEEKPSLLNMSPPRLSQGIQEPIAIIGMNGRYPQAETLANYWENLQAGKDCITEIPEERWSLEGFFHPDRDVAVAQGKSYSKWGGFMESFANFDPLFFNISPRESVNMDPQERIFIESSWGALEDAGYTRGQLVERFDNRVGVFVGITKTGYDLYGPDLWRKGEQIYPLTSFGAVANRVSYLLNLRGPSMPIDTLCSSSLTAIHEACEHIGQGKCDMALAGGVNLYLHPSGYVGLCMRQMLSQDGRCKSFGEGGNGFVPGEGVGVLVLKRLSEAVRDDDHIYAKIRGTGINHAGKTNGYMVPSPVAQGELIREVLDQSGVDARTVSYIEAHGTGTELGDPIEIRGLTQAFQKDTSDNQYCAIGSAKSNIGHLEAASGIAGVMKIVLQMKHQKIAPSLHAEALNPNIDFTQTPFFVQRESAEWKRPVITIDGTSKEYPRIAGISSFGAGGSNAHVLVEEYAEPTRIQNMSYKTYGTYIIVLSARNIERLREYAQNLLKFIQHDPDINLADLAYTLQIGRESMEERLALQVITLAELQKKLTRIIEGEEKIEDYCRGHVKHHKETMNLLADEDMALTVDAWIAKKRYAKLSELWVKGLKVDWSKLYGDRQPRRISLPTYPFSQTRYWIPTTEETIHPETMPSLIHKLESKLPKQEEIMPAKSLAVEEMDQWILKLLWEQLHAMGLMNVPRPKPAAGYDRWMKESLELFKDAGFLKEHEPSAPTTGWDAVWKEWRRKKSDWLAGPGVKAKIELVETTVKELPKILSGELPATDVMFPNSSLDLIEGIYKENPIGHYFNEVLSDTVVAYLQHRLQSGDESRIRILEIGAGTGGTSSMVFQKLKPYHGQIKEYCYTDISQVFLTYAEKEYGPENPYLTYQRFNVEVPLEEQGIRTGHYDLIIAANVLHATKNIRNTLRNAKCALRRCGLILLNEMSANSVFAHTTFGLLEGWWLYEDLAVRLRGCPGLSPESWKEVLEAEGFHSVFSPARGGYDWGQQIIVAESDGVLCPTVPRQSAPVRNGSVAEAREPRRNGNLKSDIKKVIIEKLSTSLKIEPGVVDANEPFADYGVDSITGVHLVHAINETLTTDLKTTSLFDYSSVSQLATYLISQYEDQLSLVLGHSTSDDMPSKKALSESNVTKNREISGQKDPIAIIGVSGRFAQSENIDMLWEHLVAGADLTEEVSRWILPTEELACTRGSFLSDIDCFDSLFFNISGREATYMDPQQRFFLEECWKTLEDAGYAGASMEGVCCGVYVGSSGGDYRALLGKDAPAQAMWGNMGAVIPARIAYYLNLQGPAIVVDTACSSSLVAIHLACQGLWSGEIECALAGGVFIQSTPDFYTTGNRAGMLSPSGCCHTFDERADGFVPGEGVGVVMLKRLHDAVGDRDHIYGVIRGTGINQDGKTNGLTAPSALSQERLEHRVYETFQIDPSDIQMVEAHGTGTKLGDPIEFRALTKAFGRYTDQKEYCAIGSIKTNLGHTQIAAGMAGLIKILLSLKHRQLPPSIHYESGNPAIDFKESPFYVNQTLQDWNTDAVRRAAISSFGASGTNAHLVIEEAPPRTFSPAKKPAYLMVASARTPGQLWEQVDHLVGYCERNSAFHCADMSYTLLLGRKHFSHRLVCVVANREELIEGLKQWLTDGKALGVRQFELEGNDEDEDPMLIQYGNQYIQNYRLAGREKDCREYLTAIGDLYGQGVPLDFEILFLNEEVGRISLPVYPFAKDHFWVSKPIEAEPIETEPTPDAEEPFEVMAFEENWEEQPLYEAESVAIKTLVCCLSNPESQNKVEETLRSLEPKTRVLFISYREFAHDWTRCKTAWKRIRDDHGAVDSILFLEAFEDLGYLHDFSWMVQTLQALASVKLKAGRFLFAAPFATELEQCYADAWVGFERSLALIMPNLKVAIIGGKRDDVMTSLEEWIRMLWGELQSGTLQSVIFEQGKRHVRQMRSVNLGSGRTALKEKGTYLITGGCGGLGFIFAKHLAKMASANLILMGRSALDDEKRSNIKHLEALGVRVLYIQADVCNPIQMKKAMNDAAIRFGDCHGVIHAAGIPGQQTVLEKEFDDFRAVLDPKVKGTLTLDEIVEQSNLDFICYFSSSSAILGDMGTCDYAIGNRFQMAYARYRNRRQVRGLTQGKAFAINWPLWKEGGMGLGDEETTKIYLKSSGQLLLETEEGLDLFERLLLQLGTQHLVLVGQRKRVERFLGLDKAHRVSSVASPSATVSPGRRGEMKGFNLEQCIAWDLKELASHLLKIPRDRLTERTNLADFGFDSISLADFASLLSNHYKIDITPSVFFGHSTLEKLIRLLLREYTQAVETLYNEETLSQEQTAVPRKPKKRTVKMANTAALQPVSETSLEPIAVIGMSGRFPKARTVDEMWNILETGENAVDEIPADRFDWRFYYGDPAKEAGKINSKWLGSIPGVGEFDPEFFNISPREAKMMDPRQRLLLQEAWKTLEDAGYGTSHIQSEQVGIFVGAEQGDYQLLVGAGGSVTSNHDAVLAARLAYFLNLSGPAMTINTACSSGLVAAHQACLSVWNGECDAAIAAGVNLMLTPEAYVGMSEARMLSEDGRCAPFDKRANGMVPGEAVAAVLLKRLSRAQADGDPIYAVIRGSGINYDGKTNGITAPSGASQAELLKKIYNRFRIDPREIAYIVAHGTGTRLGDPVEVNALVDAFSAFTDEKSFCALTSTKSNFAHTFAASGVVSLVSLVQALRHETIPASLNCEQENDYVRWPETSFYVNKKTRLWPEPKGMQRCGAVSAFGMSGTNAHMVLQSYPVQRKEECLTQFPCHLLALSAKTPDALRLKIDDMIRWLENREGQECDLSEVSYTLLEGRLHFEYRCAIVIQDCEDAVYVWRQSGGKEKLPNLFQGQSPEEFVGQKPMLVYADGLLRQVSSLHKDKGKYQETLSALADLYCQGYQLNWGLLWGSSLPVRVHLPTYPFSRNRYWVGHADSHPDEEAVNLEKESHHPSGRIEKNSSMAGRNGDRQWSDSMQFNPDYSLSLDELLEQVEDGALRAEQANEVFSKLKS